MAAISQALLTKLETVFKEGGYKVRYEKGNFKSGSCVLETSKVIVVNKFANLETKVAFLQEVLMQLNIDDNLLSAKIKEFYQEFKQTRLKI